MSETELKEISSRRDASWLDIALLVALVVVISLSVATMMMLVVVATRSDRDEIHKRCYGETAVFFGIIGGDGVMAINNNDLQCAHEAEPTYPGDSNPTSNPTQTAGPGDVGTPSPVPPTTTGQAR